jgi:hypothetical protein
MPIKIQDRKKIYEVDKDGKQVPVITPEVFITLTHLETGKEYLSEKEATDDVSDPNTATKIEHIRRDVEVKIAEMPPLGSDSNL